MIGKKGRFYWLDIWTGHGKTRKRVRRSLHTDERVLAIERARDLEREFRARPEGTDLIKFAAKYLEWAYVSKSASVRTEVCRVAVIKSWFASAGISTLKEVTPYHVEQFRAYLRRRMVKKSGEEHDAGRSRATINRYAALLRVMFNKAKDWGLFDGPNPVSKIKFYREGDKVRPLTEAEIGAVLNAACAISAKKDASPMGRALYDLCVLVLNTGLRKSEALNLRWLDIGDDELMVRGKNGKTRAVPINGEARTVIGRQPHLSAYLFDLPNRNSSSVLRRVMETISRRVGVRFHLHLLRHAFASRLIAAGVDIVTVSDLLGHSAAMTTLLYAHTSPGRKREAVGLLPGHRQSDVNLNSGLTD